MRESIRARDDAGNLIGAPAQNYKLNFFCEPTLRISRPAEVAANPSTIDLNDPPSEVDITSSQPGLYSSAYGMPQTEYIDENGTVQGVVTAYAISADGSSISNGMPSVPYIPIGQYVGLTGNVDQDGSTLDVVGAPSITVWNTVPSSGFLVDGGTGTAINVATNGYGIDTTYYPEIQLWSQDLSTPYTSSQMADYCDDSSCYWYSLVGPDGTGGQVIGIIMQTNSDGSQTPMANTWIPVS